MGARKTTEAGRVLPQVAKARVRRHEGENFAGQWFNPEKENIVRRTKAVALLLLVSMVLVACGKKVEVPNAHVGKILTSEGFREDVIPPSKFRMDVCFSLCDKLIVAEASDHAVVEKIRLWMPKDELNLIIDVRGIYAISDSAANVSIIFAKIPAQPVGGDARLAIISMDRVYATYAKQVIRNLVREEIAEFTIVQVMENRAAINKQLLGRINEALAGSPLQAIQFGLADVQPPTIIVKAKEIARKREVEIQQEEANKQIRLKKLEADLEAAQKDRTVRLVRAQTTAEENAIIAGSIGENWLKWRRLEVMEEMAGNERAVFFPVDMVGSIGLQTRMFQEGVK